MKPAKISPGIEKLGQNHLCLVFLCPCRKFLWTEKRIDNKILLDDENIMFERASLDEVPRNDAIILYRSETSDCSPDVKRQPLTVGQ